MRGTGRVVRGAAALTVAGAVVVCSMPAGLAAASSVPVLGAKSAFPAGKGFGSVKPKTVFLGGDPTGLFKNVTWSHWGSSKATGKGTGNYPPPGKPVADAVKVPATLVVTQLGTCHGKTAYKHMAIFFTYKGKKKTGSSLNICS
jgi:hypothetical protein